MSGAPCIVTLDSIVNVAEGVIFQDLEGEAVILNMQSEIYFGLDSTGTKIWQLIDKHHVVRTVVQLLLDEYEIAEDELKQNVFEFITKLHSKGLIEIDNGQ